jgi:hypothetical protein
MAEESEISGIAVAAAVALADVRTLLQEEVSNNSTYRRRPLVPRPVLEPISYFKNSRYAVACLE